MAINKLTRTSGSVTGTVELNVPDGYEYYNVTIESASAQTYTLKRKAIGGSRFVTFESNTMNGDSSTTFYLPGTESFEITPSSTDSYVVIMTASEGK